MKTRRFSQKVLFVLVLTFLMSNTVLANAGTGLFFPGIIHLLIGNLFIGFIEAFFVQKVFKIEVGYFIIVLGNYVSSILGYIPIIAGVFSADEMSSSGFGRALAILFVASVFTEWPFFAWAVKERMFGFSRSSFKYTFYAQCVSYALLVPFYFTFFDEGRMTARDYVENDLNNLAANAYQYRIRYGFFGGGGRSYEGFSIPEKSLVDEFGRYAATVREDSVVFVAMSTDSTRTIARVVLDSTGRLHSWEYRFKPADTQSSEKVTYHLKFLASEAYEYRMRPLSKRGIEGSYRGYSIPEKFPLSELARYSATSSKDSIVFLAISVKDSSSTMSAVLDSTGRLHSWKSIGEIQ